MKKLALLLALCLLITLFSACSGGKAPQTDVTEADNSGETSTQTDVTETGDPGETSTQPDATETGDPVGKDTEPDELAVRDLRPDTPVGVAVFLDYVDETILIFQADFGLFCYDLEKNEIRFSFDLQRAVGTTAFQGTEAVAAVHVSLDGTRMEVFNTEKPDTAYYFQISDGSYEKTDRKPFGDFFNSGLYENEQGRLFSEDDIGAVGTVMDVQFTRGDKTWRIFENYDFGEP